MMIIIIIVIMMISSSRIIMTIYKQGYHMSAYGDYALPTCDGRMLPSFCSGLAIVSKYDIFYDNDSKDKCYDDRDQVPLHREAVPRVQLARRHPEA